MKMLSLGKCSGRQASCYNLCEEQFGGMHQKALKMSILL